MHVATHVANNIHVIHASLGSRIKFYFRSRERTVYDVSSAQVKVFII